MTTETRKAKSKLAVLSASLEELESHLDPLFSQSFSETLLGLEPIQQAKLQTVIPYLVYDLVFIYLKTRGLDPKTHPVFAELEGVRQYFDKIKNAENPATRTTQVDKAAASRFIKHAITQAQIDSDVAVQASSSSGSINPALQRALESATRGESSQVDKASAAGARSKSQTTHVPVKMTAKMIERAEYEKRLREAGSEEDDELMVYDESVVPNYEQDVEMGVAQESEIEGTKSNGKGKGKAIEDVEESTSTRTGSKRRRTAMDPFAASGYGQAGDVDSPHPPPKKQIMSDVPAAAPSPVPAAPAQPKKTKKKKAKKATGDE
ncbi:hypothetical protein D9758_000543 [Tetrapyrgos nigripes]|uniref:Exosome complex protein n=1 Tax=Tetrapyrgos nigripes TaxID=182062 RepID=A0A8H5H217_9AGAR|nr:hypothetical protein D9758_000543 [Tetrapyrgos nigripes]